MTDIGKGLRTYLLTDTAIAADVGTRIFPRAMPQDATLPAIVFQLISSISVDQVDSAAGIANALVQVDIYGETHLAANNLAEDVRNAVHGYSGSMGSETVQSVGIANKIEGYLVPDDGGDDGTYRVTLDLDIVHTEAVPTF
tara:strand:- start:1083 stop:1505 length:423 start_codon:yes stop_codon:yes gene_type:complete